MAKNAPDLLVLPARRGNTRTRIFSTAEFLRVFALRLCAKSQGREMARAPAFSRAPFRARAQCAHSPKYLLWRAQCEHGQKMPFAGHVVAALRACALSTGWLAGRLAGWLAGWLAAGWLAGWLAGPRSVRQIVCANCAKRSVLRHGDTAPLGLSAHCKHRRRATGVTACWDPRSATGQELSPTTSQSHHSRRPMSRKRLTGCCA